MIMPTYDLSITSVELMLKLRNPLTAYGIHSRNPLTESTDSTDDNLHSFQKYEKFCFLFIQSGTLKYDKNLQKPLPNNNDKIKYQPQQIKLK